MNFSIVEEELNNFKVKYQYLHPLIFHRSLEKARSVLDLFEILETVPKIPPFSWNEEKRCWFKEKDSLNLEKLKLMIIKNE